MFNKRSVGSTHSSHGNLSQASITSCDVLSGDGVDVPQQHPPTISEQRSHSSADIQGAATFQSYFLFSHNENSKLFPLKSFLKVWLRQTEPSDHPQRCLRLLESCLIASMKVQPPLCGCDFLCVFKRWFVCCPAALRGQPTLRAWASGSPGSHGGMCSDSESAGGSSESRSMDSPTASPGRRLSLDVEEK